MGKSSPKVKIGPLEKEQADFMRSQRKDLIEPVQGALMPLALPSAMQAFDTRLMAPDREAIEGQFNQAKNDIMAGGARGGLLRRAMTQADIGRAGAVSRAAVQARQQGIERGLGLLGPAAFPGANTTMSAANSLVGGEQSRNAANAQMKAQGQAQTGQAIGTLAGLAGMAAMMF